MRRRLSRPPRPATVVLVLCLSFQGCARQVLSPGLTQAQFEALVEGSTPDEARKLLGPPILEVLQVAKDGTAGSVHWIYGKQTSWRATSYSVPRLTFVNGRLASRAWDSAALEAPDEPLLSDGLSK